MTESAILDKSIKTFLLGVSVGTIMATILRPREEKRLPEPARATPAHDRVDTASEDSFPASDPPGY